MEPLDRNQEVHYLMRERTLLSVSGVIWRYDAMCFRGNT
jgi:hypothetical protein